MLLPCRAIKPSALQKQAYFTEAAESEPDQNRLDSQFIPEASPAPRWFRLLQVRAQTSEVFWVSERELSITDSEEAWEIPLSIPVTIS